MNHLTDRELVEWLDGNLPAVRQAHLDGCAGCREQAHEMRRVLAQVEDVRVPEPSPLFWDHLPARVAEATVAAPARGVPGWTPWFRRRWPVLSACAALVVVGLALSPRLIPHVIPHASGATPVVAERAAVQRNTSVSNPTDADADEAWALVQLVADEVPWEQARDAGLSAQPGSAERMALELSPREQSELAHLLRDELKGSGL